MADQIYQVMLIYKFVYINIYLQKRNGNQSIYFCYLTYMFKYISDVGAFPNATKRLSPTIDILQNQETTVGSYLYNILFNY